MQKGTSVVASLVLGYYLTACGSSSTVNTESAGGSPSAKSADTRAAQQSSQSIDDAAASDTSTSAQGSAVFFALEALEQALNANNIVTRNFNDTITIQHCTATVSGTVTVSNGTWSLNANTSYVAADCTGKQKLDGTDHVVATRSGSGSTYQRSVDVTQNLVRTYANGDTVTISRLDPTLAYTYAYVAKGRALDGATSLQVMLNAHRVRKASDGNKIFDHNITTPVSVSVDNVYTINGGRAVPQTRTVVSGSIDLHHNLAHFNATQAFSNVVRNLTGTCLCPQSGTILQTVTKDDGSGTYVREYTFTGCGTATVKTSASTLKGTENGTATVTWDDCTN